MLSTIEVELTSAAALLRSEGVVEAAYEVLDDLVTRLGANGACMVLHPVGRGPQLFRSGRRTVAPAEVEHLVGRPTGLYLEPPAEVHGGPQLAALFEVAFQLDAAAREARIETPSGLASRYSIEAALVRAAASAARYGWRSTAVLLATDGSGPPGERWQIFRTALTRSLRTGDEAGAVGRGTVLALLGNAGADTVRPFLGRLRAELSATGGDGIDLFAGTASTPAESVDPSELWRLAADRLRALGIEGDLTPAADELSLRMGPDVVCVGTDSEGSLVAVSPRCAPRREHGRASVEPAGSDLLNHISGETAPRTALAVRLEPARRSGSSAAQGAPPTNGNGNQRPITTLNTDGVDAPNGDPLSLEIGRAEGCVPPAAPVSATAPGSAFEGMHRRPGRIEILDALFDVDRGVSEVRLGRRGTRSSGRAPAGALAGGAQATLLALSALGLNVPFYLVSVERASSVPGGPVIVMLAPRLGDSGNYAGERIGIARGADDVEAASRATLNALNRFLNREAPQA